MPDIMALSTERLDANSVSSAWPATMRAMTATVPTTHDVLLHVALHGIDDRAEGNLDVTCVTGAGRNQLSFRMGRLFYAGVALRRYRGNPAALVADRWVQRELLAWAYSWHTTPGCGRLGTSDAYDVEIVDE